MVKDGMHQPASRGATRLRGLPRGRRRAHHLMRTASSGQALGRERMAVACFYAGFAAVAPRWRTYRAGKRMATAPQGCRTTAARAASRDASCIYVSSGAQLWLRRERGTRVELYGGEQSEAGQVLTAGWHTHTNKG